VVYDVCVCVVSTSEDDDATFYYCVLSPVSVVTKVKSTSPIS